MLDEVVEKRGWLTREHFLQLVGVTNLLPGPNSSEVAIHVGYTQRGWTGALATGLTFLLPTFVMVTTLSWLYFGYGTLPAVEPIFWGVQPVVVGLIVWAGVKLGRTAVSRPLHWVLAAAGAGVSVVDGRWAVAAMVVGGAVSWTLWKTGAEGDAEGAEAEERQGDAAPESEPPSRSVLFPLPVLSAALAAPAALFSTLWTVLWTHLWIGAVLFGGGYVLIVLLEPQAVDRFGWLTAAQFLDGVALTQAVPGPISTLSAFVGYAAAGVPGAALGTAGVYLPAFAAVLFVAPHLERLRTLEPVKATLDGVGAVVAGAIVGIAVTLLPPAVPDPWAGALFVAALVALYRFELSAVWVVGGGLAAGVLRMLAGGV